jgi:uncharacterized Zn finger protein
MAESEGCMRLTREALLETAGQVYFARGEDNFHSEAVSSLRERDGSISATVLGSHPYKTSLVLRDGMLNGRCTCPLGQDGQFCKHLVATGLAFIDQQETGRNKGKNEKPIAPKDVEVYLSNLDRSDLVRLIMEQAGFDDELEAALRMRTATDADKPNILEMKRVLRQALDIPDFVSWRETYDYSRGVDRILGQLRTMLTEKHAAEVIELAEYAMDLWEENIGSIDDSDGSMGMIRDDLHQLHLEACNLANPEPVALAERLAQRAINSEWEMFYDSYRTYADVFGKAGRKHYREIVEAEWEMLPRVGPGEEDPQRYGRSSTLDHMMLAIAEKGDDLDLAIKVLSRDLSHCYVYLRIAQRCRESRDHAKAVQWAESGIAAFPKKTDFRLRNFLADEYVRAKRPDDAMAMIWVNLEGRTSLETYQDLAKYARKLKCWESWREKAFGHIRTEIKNRKAEFDRQYGDRATRGQASSRRWTPPQPDHSLLVAIFLWEKREVDAWAEACNGGCSEHLWLDLAKRREKRHPEDAIEIYRRQVEPLINQTKNRAYEEAIGFLGRIHDLMNKIGKEGEFRVELVRIKTEFKRKRNFIKFVERRAWGKWSEEN